MTDKDLLELLDLLVESMPPEICADGYGDASNEQRQARLILQKLKEAAEEKSHDTA